MAKIGVRRDRLFIICTAHQRRRDHRHRAHDHRFVGQPRFFAQGGDGGAEAIDNRQPLGRGQNRGQAAERPHPRGTQCGPHFRLAHGLARASGPQSRRHPLKTGLGGQRSGPLPGDDQLAARAINMAESGFGGGDTIQADGQLFLQCHGTLLCCVATKIGAYFIWINLD